MYFATNPGRRGASQHPWSSSMRSVSRAGLRLGLGNDGEILRDLFAGQSGAPAAGNVQAVVAQAMTQGALYTAEDCSGIPAKSGITQTLLQTGGAMALKIAPLTGPAAPFVMIAGGVMQLFGALFAHHSAKVKQEQQIICAVVAACNDSFTSIDQLVQTGQITPQQGMQALDSMQTQLAQQVQVILKQDKDHCNAACFVLAEARGVIAKRKDQYSRIPPSNAPAGSYQLSCRNMVVNGDVLTAECQDPQNSWTPTSVSSLSTCAAIDNVNGQLKCTQQAAAPAPGVSQALSPASSNPGDLVNSLAQSVGIPSWAVWGIGALLLMKVIE